MQNIHELFGIIKGIDFDDVINSKEIDKLRSWVDRNRNLALLADEQKVIKLVDDVIEDNIITEEEKQELNTFINEYYERNGLGDITCNGVYVSIISELSGIIEAIVCDDELNEKEIRRLESWLRENEEYIKNDENFKSLKNQINDILEDGIVTEDEQLILLNSLKEQISFKKFLDKLNILINRVQQKRNIGIELIDLLDNESTIKNIHKLADMYLLQTLTSYSNTPVHYEVIFISLVLIAMIDYDGNFYDYVKAAYPRSFEKYNEQKIGSVIRNIIRRCGYYPEFNGVRVINDVLRNAVVPQNFLPNFFDFVYDIYRFNFDYTLPESEFLAEEISDVYEALRKDAKKIEDAITVSETKKTYKLIHTTQELISKEDTIKPVVDLTTMVIRIIDKKIWEKPLKLYSPYLKKGFNTWVQTITPVEARNRKNAPRSAWLPEYRWLNEEVYLSPPMHKIFRQKIPFGKTWHDFSIQVLTKNEIVYEDINPRVEEMIGGYKVSTGSIVLNNPISDITYRVMCGDTIIWESEDKLFRKHIVFNTDGYEIKNNNDYKGTAVFCLKEKRKGFDTFYLNQNYILASKSVDYDTVIVFENETFGFSSLLKPGVFGDVYKDCFIKDVQANKKIPVYKSVKFLMFECLNSVSDVLIRFGRTIFTTRELKATRFMKGTSIKYVVDMPVLDPGIYNVQVYEKLPDESCGKLIYQYSFVYDADFDFEVMAVSEKEYHVDFKSGLISEQKEICYKTTDHPENGILFSYKGNNYEYHIPMEINFYRIDDKEWISQYEPLWIEDIASQSVLQILGNYADRAIIYNQANVLLEEIPIRQCGSYMEFSVGSLLNYKSGNWMLVINLMNEGRIKRRFYCANQCFVDYTKTNAEYFATENMLRITPYFYGSAKTIRLVISDDKEMTVVDHNVIAANETIEIKDILKAHTAYKARILIKPFGLFAKEYEDWSQNIKFFTLDDLVGHTFKMNGVECLVKQQNTLVLKDFKLNEVYLEIDAKLDESNYRGNVFLKRNNKKQYLGRINPVILNIEEDIEDNILNISISDCRDNPLHYYIEEKNILNLSRKDPLYEIKNCSITIE